MDRLPPYIWIYGLRVICTILLQICGLYGHFVKFFEAQLWYYMVKLAHKFEFIASNFEVTVSLYSILDGTQPVILNMSIKLPYIADILLYSETYIKHNIKYGNIICHTSLTYCHIRKLKSPIILNMAIHQQYTVNLSPYLILDDGHNLQNWIYWLLFIQVMGSLWYRQNYWLKGPWPRLVDNFPLKWNKASEYKVACVSGQEEKIMSLF